MESLYELPHESVKEFLDKFLKKCIPKENPEGTSAEISEGIPAGMTY